MSADKEAPALVSTGVEELIKHAQALGLTWNMRLATVLAPQNVNKVQATYDGDTIAIGMIAINGPYTTNDRVYVIQVPPAGNYVIGAANGNGPMRRVATTTSILDSAANSGEQVVLSVTASLVANRTYKIRFEGGWDGDTIGGIVIGRIREDSISGTVIQGRRYEVSTTAGTTGMYAALEVEYSPSVTGAKTFVLTSQGGGNVFLAASTSSPAYLYVDYIY